MELNQEVTSGILGAGSRGGRCEGRAAWGRWWSEQRTARETSSRPCHGAADAPRRPLGPSGLGRSATHHGPNRVAPPAPPSGASASKHRNTLSEEVWGGWAASAARPSAGAVEDTAGRESPPPMIFASNGRYACT